MKFKNPNMVFYYEQNVYTNIDARDGREWDALLRASARKLKRICQFWVGLNLKSPRTRPKPYLIPLVLHIVQCRFYYRFAKADGKTRQVLLVGFGPQNPPAKADFANQLLPSAFANSYPACVLEFRLNYHRIQSRPISGVTPSHHTLYSIRESDTIRLLG